MAISENQVWSDLPVSPGSVLEEEIEARAMTQKELARRMGRPPQVVNEIIRAKKSITPETALELEKVLGMPAQLWVNLESVYRMTKAKNEERERLHQEASALSRFPVKEMAKHGWIPAFKQREDKVRALLEFLGVASLAGALVPDRRRLSHNRGRQLLPRCLGSMAQEGRNRRPQNFNSRLRRGPLPGSDRGYQGLNYSHAGGVSAQDDRALCRRRGCLRPHEGTPQEWRERRGPLAGPWQGAYPAEFEVEMGRCFLVYFFSRGGPCSPASKQVLCRCNRNRPRHLAG